MEHLLHTLLSFFVVLSVIVFIHEFGHYLVAKLCGVKIEAFSIGFGRELLGFNDRSGTRWKLSLLPLGGYVKMFGDAGAASTPDDDRLSGMSPQERAQAFHFKPLWQKAAIVVAGPASNFLLTIGVLTWFICSGGLPSTEPVVGEVMQGTAAEAAGLQPNDRILRIDGKEVATFNDIPGMIATNLGEKLELSVLRGGETLAIPLTPRFADDEDALGNKIKHPLIGIRTAKVTFEQVGPLRAVGEATARTYDMCASTIKVLGQMVTGKRGTQDLRGPIGIAQLSGQAAEKDASTLLWLIAMISANLGLVNLFPIPMLDGGHLAFYAMEAARGRPMAQRFQEWSFRAGFALLLMLMALTFYNDLSKIFA